MKPGLYTSEQLSNEDYHKSEPISSSGLKLMLRTPAHFKYPQKDTSTRAKDMGSAIHCAILEPDRYALDYRVVDCEDRRSAIYKAACKDRDGAYVLTQAEGDNIAGMTAGILRNRACRELIEIPGQYELSLVVADPVTGVLVKVRYDKLSGDMPIDLKKTQDASRQAFEKSIFNYGYHISAALYQDAWEWLFGEKLQEMRWLTVEEKSPHAAARYRAEQDSLAIGRALYRDALNKYAECLDNDEWPAYGDDEEEVGIPGWAVGQFEDSLEVNFDEE